MRVLPRLLPFTVLLFLLAFAGSAPQHDVTFVQISDAHLFDAGKKRTPEKDATPEDLKLDEEQRRAEKLDTYAAWDWAISYVNYLQEFSNKKIKFVVFTGDFGLEKVMKPNSSAPSTTAEANNAKKTDLDQQGCWDFQDAAKKIATSFKSLNVDKIYLVRGNNDLADEDPSDADRFDMFIDAVKAEIIRVPPGQTPPRVPTLFNLTPTLSIGPGSSPRPSPAPSIDSVDGYTIIGLDSSSFKNQLKSDPPKCGEPTKLSDDQKDSYQRQELERVRKEIEQTNQPTLIFTHIPDLDDPSCVDRKAPCARVTSWNLANQAYKIWDKIVQADEVVGIFAGHFHYSKRTIYDPPYKGRASDNPPYSWTISRNKAVLSKTYVVPPLAPKFQIRNVNEQSRGFALITVAGNNVIWEPYWLNTLPLAGVYQDGIKPSRQQANGPKNIVACWTVFTIAILISAGFLCTLLLKRKKFARNNSPSQGESEGLAEIVASKWAEHLFQEWKYRHDNFWRKLYRFLAAIAVLVTAPFIKSEYFGPIAGGLGVWVYVFLPFIIFCSLCFALTHEQAKLKCVERQLENARLGKSFGRLEKPNPWKELADRWITAICFVAIGLILWAFWACELLSQYAEKTT